jgi:hypothetical protein
MASGRFFAKPMMWHLLHAATPKQHKTNKNLEYSDKICKINFFSLAMILKTLQP